MLPVLKMSTARWWYLLALIIITLDQLSKYWVQANFELYERLPLLSFLDFTLVYNEGAAWSFLSDAGGWQRWLFTAISLGVSVVLVVWMARLQGNQHLLLIALTFILGGAVGNLIDRVLLGKVGGSGDAPAVLGRMLGWIEACGPHLFGRPKTVKRARA